MGFTEITLVGSVDQLPFSGSSRRSSSNDSVRGPGGSGHAPGSAASSVSRWWRVRIFQIIGPGITRVSASLPWFHLENGIAGIAAGETNLPGPIHRCAFHCRHWLRHSTRAGRITYCYAAAAASPSLLVPIAANSSGVRGRDQRLGAGWR